MQSWLRNLIINFFIGGFVTASISYSGTFLSPALAAIWWAFPISLLPSMYYMHIQGKSNSQIASFTITTTYALIILFFTTLSLGYFFKWDKKSFWMPILKSVGVFLVLGIIYYSLIKIFNLEKYFS
jgi:hypothetical protein